MFARVGPKSPTALLDMHHLSCRISCLLPCEVPLSSVYSLFHSPHQPYPAHYHLVTDTTFTLTFYHSLVPRPSTPDFNLIFFTNPFVHSLSDSFRNRSGVPSRILILQPVPKPNRTKWILAFVSLVYFYTIRYDSRV